MLKLDYPEIEAGQISMVEQLLPPEVLNQKYGEEVIKELNQKLWMRS